MLTQAAHPSRFRLAFHKAGVLFPPLTKWAAVLSGVVLEQERMLPILLDLLDTNSDVELRPLTGLLRNLARHSSNKDHMGRWRISTAFVPGTFRSAHVLCLGSYQRGEGVGVKAAQRWAPENTVL